MYVYRIWNKKIEKYVTGNSGRTVWLIKSVALSQMKTVGPYMGKQEDLEVHMLETKVVKEFANE